jgi:hypothetical protein
MRVAASKAIESSSPDGSLSDPGTRRQTQASQIKVKIIHHPFPRRYNAECDGPFLVLPRSFCREQV